MDLPRNLQIPHSVKECIYLMRSYIYIDKYTCEVHIREISPCFGPAFVLGVCAQIPFLYNYVKPYIKGNVDIIFVQFPVIHFVCEFIDFSFVCMKYYPNQFRCTDVMLGTVYEVTFSDLYEQEMVRNEFMNAQLLYYSYTPAGQSINSYIKKISS